MSRKQLVLVPYCVRNIECRAEEVDGELRCDRHNCTLFNSADCGIYNLIVEAQSRGMPIRILRHDDAVHRILDEESPDVVLGLPCLHKKEKVTSMIQSMGIECHSVCLNSDCHMKTKKIPVKYSLDKYVALLDSVK